MRDTDTVKGREKGQWSGDKITAERGSEGGPAIPGETRTGTERGGGQWVYLCSCASSIYVVQ